MALGRWLCTWAPAGRAPYLEQQLRQWREDAGLTQRDLGRKLKKVHTFVAKSEQGERRLDPIEFIRWCEACGVDRSEAIRQIKT